MRPALRLGAAGLLFLLAAPASGQTPDSTAAPVPEAAVEPALARPADSLRVDTTALPRPSVAPFGAAPGHPVTPIPALTAALDPTALLADVPGAFVYRLGAPGFVGGASLAGLSPHAPSLRLDGRPLDDVLTGAPRVDLLPAAAVGPLRLGATEAGRPLALSASVRPFRLEVPVTELRYLTGQENIQQISGTHAQTRRPPAFLRGGSDDARLTATGHVGSRRSDRPLAGAAVRHLDALGRLLLTRPGLAAEAGIVHADRTIGAGPSRRTLRTEAWTRARLPLVAEPLELGASYGTQRLVYVPTTRDTLRVHVNRAAAFARQPVRLGGHALALRLDAVWSGDPHAGLDALGDPGARLDVSAVVSDSLRLGALAIAAEAGAHRVADVTIPAGAFRAEAGPAFASVAYGGRARSFAEAAGIAGVLVADPRADAERTLRAEAGLSFRASTFRFDVRAFGSRRTNAREYISQGDTLVLAISGPEAVEHGGVSLGVGWRDNAQRGLYLRAEGTAQAIADTAGSALAAGLDRALPRVWGTGRLGVRAVDVGDGILDLDLAAVVTAWTPFESRVVEPVTGLLALPDRASLGPEIPGRATLGLEATATFSARASLFLRYDNALGDRVYTGPVVTRGEPLPAHVLRFGVFWALVN